MKKSVFLVIAVLFTLISCEKVELPQFDAFPQNGKDLISIEVNDGQSQLKSSNGDTIIVVSNKRLIFSYTVDPSITVVGQIWTFHDGTTSQEKMPSYPYNGYGMLPITLVVQTDDNQQFERIVYLDLYTRGNLQPIIFLGSDPAGANTWNVHVALYKNAFFPLHSSNYQIKGTVTPTPWGGSITIAAADTNYRLDNNSLHYVSGEFGDWVKGSFLISTGTHEMAVYKTKNSQEVWGQFKGSQFTTGSNYGLIKFFVEQDGSVSSEQGFTEVPGEGGDLGVNGVTRLSRDGDYVTVYLNQHQNFSNISPFFRKRLDNGLWGSNQNLESVAGFINWGKYVAHISTFPHIVRYGPEIGDPNVLNQKIAESVLWNNHYEALEITLAMIEQASK